MFGVSCSVSIDPDDAHSSPGSSDGTRLCSSEETMSFGC